MSRFDVDCVIVGAGAAGLAAAADLVRAGIHVAIVEARDRIGGRIHTVRASGFAEPMELGAEYVHGEDEESFSLAQLAKAPVCQVGGEHFHFFRNRLMGMPDFEEKLKRVMGGLAKAGKRQSFLDYLNARFPAGRAKYALQRSLGLAFVQGFDAAHPERVSAKSLAEEAEASGDEQYRILGGYDRLLEPFTEALRSELTEIHLNRVVTEIAWKPGSVQVTMRPRLPIRARCALVTLPLGVWQAPSETPGAVRFEPELPEKRAIVKRLAVGPVIKILMAFHEPFWLEHRPWKLSLKQLSFVHSSGEAVPTWWTAMPLRTPMLTGWCAGPAADGLSGKPVGVIRDRALESLGRMLAFPRKKLESLLRAVHIANWQADPFARGAYSYALVGGDGAGRELARPVKSTLFFAGEAAHHEGPSGTVPAALSSGHRAAKEILKSLGKRG